MALRYTLPLLHPSAIVRGQWHEEASQVAYLRRLKQLLAGSYTPPDMAEPPPGSLMYPTLATLEQFDRELAEYDALSIDLENAGDFITLAGLTAMRLTDEAIGSSLSLPIRARYGERYWQTRPNHDRAVEYLGDWLADPRLAKVFQNGLTHDVPILERHGFVVAGEIWDTMTMSHYCYPEMRKALQYNCTLYLGVGVWKDLVDEDEEAEGKA